MGEISHRNVSATLEQSGLHGPAFDIAEIADAAAGWLEAGKELDRLLEDHPVGDPTSFEAAW